MSRVRIWPGLRYVHNDHLYEVKSVLDQGWLEILQVPEKPKARATRSSISIRSAAKLTRLILDGKAVCVEEDVNAAKGPAQDALTRQHLPTDFTMLQARYRRIAWWRWRIVCEIAGLTVRNDDAITKAIDKAVEALRREGYKEADFGPPCRRTAYYWYDRYLRSAGDIRSLVPRYPMGGTKRINNTVEHIIQTEIQNHYMKRERRTIQQTYGEIRSRVTENNLQMPPKNKLKPPSYETVYNRIKSLPPYEVMAARYGKRAAEQHFRMVRPTGSERLTRIMQLVEMDHTPLKIFLADEHGNVLGRPTLTLAWCKYSACPVGFYLGFENPSYQTIMSCLYHAIGTKAYVKKQYPNIKGTWDAYGLPEAIAVDRGKDFQGEDLDHACAQLGIQVIDCPVYSPWYKGSVERFFRTIHEGLLAGMPGRTFSNPVEKGDYKPGKLLTINAFIELFHKWLIDDYMKNPSKALGGRSPADVWKQGLGEAAPALPANMYEVRVLLASKETRKIQRSGIQLHGLMYNSPTLNELMKRGSPEVEIKYDKWDLGVIWVYDRETRQYFEVQAIDYEHAKGLSLRQHQALTLAQKPKSGALLKDLGLARSELTRLIEEGVVRKKKKQLKQKAQKTLIAINGQAVIPQYGNHNGNGAAPVVPRTAQSTRGMAGYSAAVTGLVEDQ